MNDLASRILDDTWRLIEHTMRLLPYDMLQARMERALSNEFAALQAKVRAVADGDRVTPWSFRNVAPQRHEEWLYALRGEFTDLLQEEAPKHLLSFRVNSILTALVGARRILEQADVTLQGLFERGECHNTLLERLSRHEQVYNTKNIPAFECSLVDGQVIAGRNPLTERDAVWMDAVGVTHVLDLREDWEWAPPRFGAEALSHLGFKRFHLPVADMQAPSAEDLDAACRYFDEALTNPRALVYVHCRAGRERTASVLCAWFCRRYGLSYDKALAVLRQRRSTVQPLPAQERAVRAWLHAQ